MRSNFASRKALRLMSAAGVASVVGGVFGGFLVWALWPWLNSESITLQDRPPLIALPLICLVATVICLLGVLVTSPIWYLLHRANIVRWWIAVICGLLIGAAAGFAPVIALTPPFSGNLSASDAGGWLVQDGVVTFYGWARGSRLAAVMGLVGVSVATTLQMVAYRNIAVVPIGKN